MIGAASHRLLVTGGFDLQCTEGCTTPKVATVGVDVRTAAGAGGKMVTRKGPVLTANSPTGGVSLSEVLTLPADVCNPCTIHLTLQAPGAAADTLPKIQASAIRLGLVDLGPVSS